MADMHDCMTPAAGEITRLGLGAYAMAYQQLGYAVLGLGFASKRPHPDFRHGVKWATTDPAMVPWLWGREKMAGVGIATGQASRLMVVDLDVKAGEDGPMAFGEFLVTQPFVPIDVVGSTPTGGWHIWLRTPPGWPVAQRLGILPGVDIKGDGGYVVVPPTQVMVDSTDGQVRLPYRWVSGCPCSVPPAPTWLLHWAATAEGTGKAATMHEGGAPVDLEQLSAEGLPAGGRNVGLHRLACALYRRYGTTGAGISQVRDTLAPVLAKTDMRGFGRDEVERVLASARSFIAADEQRVEEGWRSR